MRRTGIAALFMAFAGLTGCQESGGNDTTRLTLLLTDAPGEVIEAVVTISEIYLQGGDDETGGDGGRVTLRSQPVTTDLLSLANSVATLVDDIEVPSGSYGQLRFVIEGAYLTVDEAGGQVVFATPDYAEAPAQVDGELKCPSCGQSGLKVSFPGAIVLEGSAQTLTVDFDVAESFGHEAGQSGKWIMHPSLKAVTPSS